MHIMKTREQLLKEHAEQLKALDLEIEQTKSLPIPPTSFCGPTWKAPYITYRNEQKYFPNNVHTMPEALGIIEAYRPYMVLCEARKAGCTSILPSAIQEKDYLEGEYRFDSAVSLVVKGGDGYQTTEIQFYALVKEKHFRVSIEIQRNHKWSPSITREESYYGRKGRYIVKPMGFGADHFIKWSSGDGTGRTNDYHITYHWETLDSFLTWEEATLDSFLTWEEAQRSK
jgi:hypothetical protein